MPARECAATIGEILARAIMPYKNAGLVDDVVVVDGGSQDATVAVARAAGARVLDQDALLPEHGPALRKLFAK